MSDNWLRLIPTDPGWLPTRAETDTAVNLLRSWLPEAQDVTSRVSDQIEFVDQGANFERVTCPSCGSEVAMDSWSEAVGLAYESEFTNLSITTACCGQSTSLNDLHYEWPAGFARFVMEAKNPNGDLSDAQIVELADAIGSSLRRIWAHD
jgi:hypothetical protein